MSKAVRLLVALMLSVVGSGAVAATASAAPPGVLIHVTLADDLAPSIAVVDATVLEIYSGGTLVVDVPTGFTGLQSVESSLGVDCQIYRGDEGGLETVQVACDGLPAGTYMLGADGPYGIGYSVDNCGGPGTPLETEPLDDPSAVLALSEGAEESCELEALYETNVVGQRWGAAAPWEHTSAPFAPSTIGIYDALADEAFDATAFPSTAPAAPELGCAGFTVGTSIQTLCAVEPSDHVLTGEVPAASGLAVDPMWQCAVGIPTPTFVDTLGSLTVAPTDNLTACQRYVGTGVPIYIDATLTNPAAGATLADFTFEVYDEWGSLVGTAVDPDPGLCTASDSVPAASTSFTTYQTVVDDSMCGVVYVAPGGATLPGSMTSRTYTIEVFGDRLSSVVPGATELTGAHVGPDDDGDGPGTPIDPPEPLTTTVFTTTTTDATTGFLVTAEITATIETTTTDGTGGTPSSGESASGAGDELPQTGAQPRWATAAVALLLTAGLVLVGASRRRGA